MKVGIDSTSMTNCQPIKFSAENNKNSNNNRNNAQANFQKACEVIAAQDLYIQKLLAEKQGRKNSSNGNFNRMA